MSVPRFYPDEGTRVVIALHKIALEVAAIAVSPRTTCTVCGCLIRRGETCPKCALDSAAMHRRTHHHITQ